MIKLNRFFTFLCEKKQKALKQSNKLNKKRGFDLLILFHFLKMFYG